MPSFTPAGESGWSFSSLSKPGTMTSRPCPLAWPHVLIATVLLAMTSLGLLGFPANLLGLQFVLPAAIMALVLLLPPVLGRCPHAARLESLARAARLLRDFGFCLLVLGVLIATVLMGETSRGDDMPWVSFVVSLCFDAVVISATLVVWSLCYPPLIRGLMRLHRCALARRTA